MLLLLFTFAPVHSTIFIGCGFHSHICMVWLGHLTFSISCRRSRRLSIQTISTCVVLFCQGRTVAFQVAHAKGWHTLRHDQMCAVHAYSLCWLERAFRQCRMGGPPQYCSKPSPRRVSVGLVGRQCFESRRSTAELHVREPVMAQVVGFAEGDDVSSDLLDRFVCKCHPAIAARCKVAATRQDRSFEIRFYSGRSICSYASLCGIQRQPRWHCAAGGSHGASRGTWSW